MLYTIYHLTKFQYSEPVAESVVEIRMQPRTDLRQSCLQFNLNLKPAADLHQYQDHNANIIHHFDIPKKHSILEITAESTVDVFPSVTLPEKAPVEMWDAIYKLTFHPDFWEFTCPSHFARPTALLMDLAHQLGIER